MLPVQVLPMLTLYASMLCPDKLPTTSRGGRDYLERTSPESWEVKCCILGWRFDHARCCCVPGFGQSVYDYQSGIRRHQQMLSTIWKDPEEEDNRISSALIKNNHHNIFQTLGMIRSHNIKQLLHSKLRYAQFTRSQGINLQKALLYRNVLQRQYVINKLAKDNSNARIAYARSQSDQTKEASLRKNGFVPAITNPTGIANNLGLQFGHNLQTDGQFHLQGGIADSTGIHHLSDGLRQTADIHSLSGGSAIGNGITGLRRLGGPGPRGGQHVLSDHTHTSNGVSGAVLGGQGSGTQFGDYSLLLQRNIDLGTDLASAINNGGIIKESNTGGPHFGNTGVVSSNDIGILREKITADTQLTTGSILQIGDNRNNEIFTNANVGIHINQNGVGHVHAVGNNMNIDKTNFATGENIVQGFKPDVHNNIFLNGNGNSEGTVLDSVLAGTTGGGNFNSVSDGNTFDLFLTDTAGTAGSASSHMMDPVLTSAGSLDVLGGGHADGPFLTDTINGKTTNLKNSGSMIDTVPINSMNFGNKNSISGGHIKDNVHMDSTNNQLLPKHSGSRIVSANIGVDSNSNNGRNRLPTNTVHIPTGHPNSLIPGTDSFQVDGRANINIAHDLSQGSAANFEAQHFVAQNKFDLPGSLSSSLELTGIPPGQKSVGSSGIGSDSVSTVDADMFSSLIRFGGGGGLGDHGVLHNNINLNQDKINSGIIIDPILGNGQILEQGASSTRNDPEINALVAILKELTAANMLESGLGVTNLDGQPTNNGASGLNVDIIYGLGDSSLLSNTNYIVSEGLGNMIPPDLTNSIGRGASVGFSGHQHASEVMAEGSFDNNIPGEPSMLRPAMLIADKTIVESPTPIPKMLVTDTILLDHQRTPDSNKIGIQTLGKRLASLDIARMGRSGGSLHGSVWTNNGLKMAHITTKSDTPMIVTTNGGIVGVGMKHGNSTETQRADWSVVNGRVVGMGIVDGSSSRQGKRGIGYMGIGGGVLSSEGKLVRGNEGFGLVEASSPGSKFRGEAGMGVGDGVSAPSGNIVGGDVGIKRMGDVSSRGSIPDRGDVGIGIVGGLTPSGSLHTSDMGMGLIGGTSSSGIERVGNVNRSVLDDHQINKGLPYISNVKDSLVDMNIVHNSVPGGSILFDGSARSGHPKQPTNTLSTDRSGETRNPASSAATTHTGSSVTNSQFGFGMSDIQGIPQNVYQSSNAIERYINKILTISAAETLSAKDMKETASKQETKSATDSTGGRFVSQSGQDLVPSIIPKKILELNPDVCLGCTMDGGLGYIRHPTRCDQFIVCYPDRSGHFKPRVQDCPYGQFWSNIDVTCRPSKNVNCENDICKTAADNYKYSYSTNCVAFWQCQAGHSIISCCPVGTMFVLGEGCVYSSVCGDRCPVNSPSQYMWQVNCNKRPLTSDVTTYEKHAPSGWVTETCTAGHIFKQEICDCIPADMGNPTYSFNGVCKPEVFLPFDIDFKDYSGSNTYIRTENVTLMNGAACFDGSSVIAMPKFANMDFGKTVFMKIRYKQGDLKLETEALLYNGDCDEIPTFVIGTKPSGNSFSVKTNIGLFQTAWVPSSVPAEDWREVTVTISGGRLEGRSDVNAGEMDVAGGIARSHCGIKLGWGKSFKNFVGCIDEVSIYRCLPNTRMTLDGRIQKIPGTA